MKGREIVEFITREGLLNEDLFLTDVYGNTYGYMTVDEYATNIGAGPAVVMAMIKRGDLEHVNILGQVLIPDGERVQKINKYMSEPKEEYDVGYFLNTGNIIIAHDICAASITLAKSQGYVKASALGFLTGNINLQDFSDDYGWVNCDSFLITKINGRWGVLVPRPQKLEVY